MYTHEGLYMKALAEKCLEFVCALFGKDNGEMEKNMAMFNFVVNL